MKINKEQLLQALAIVKPALANKDILEQATSFAFSEGQVLTYNDEISISHPVEGIDFEGAIKAEELYGLLTKLKKDEIDLELKETELQVKSGRVSAGLRLEEEIKLPINEIPGKWKKLQNPKQFKEFMIMAAQTCSSDMTLPKLTCVCVRKEGQVIGSDSYRLVQCQGEPNPVADFLIPATSVMELVKINPTHIQLEKQWIHFRNKQGTVFSSRRVNETYIDKDKIEEVLAVKGKGKIEFPIKILEMLGRLKQFAKRDFSFDEIVEVEIKKGKIIMKASAIETKSWIEEKASIDCQEDLSFMMNPTLFENILKVTRSCVLDTKSQKVKFVLEEEEEFWEYIIMLVG